MRFQFIVQSEGETAGARACGMLALPRTRFEINRGARSVEQARFDATVPQYGGTVLKDVNTYVSVLVCGTVLSAKSQVRCCAVGWRIAARDVA